MEYIAFLRNASVGRGGREVLSNVSLSVSKSEFVYLVGKTGSGKSSLLKAFWGEIPLLSGEGGICGYKLTGIRHSEVPALRRKVGIVFQDFHLFKDWTLEENLSYVLEATGWKSTTQRQQRIARVLAEVELSRYSGKLAGQLSGGEQQRLVLARSMLNTPEIILADEPTGNLDPDTSVEILKLLHNLAMQYNTAILMATHDMNLIQKFPGRVYQCANGAVRELD